MKPVIPYLIFPGTCRQAIEFYAACLGGEIVTMTTVRDSPIEAPDNLGDRIFNSEVHAGDLRLRASDDMPGHDVTVGTNVCLFVRFSDDQNREAVFEKLSNGGNILFPLEGNFSMVEDQFKVRWMLVLEDK